MSKKVNATMRKITLFVAIALLVTMMAACSGASTTAATTAATTKAATTAGTTAAGTTAAATTATTKAADTSDILVGFSASITGSTPVEGEYSRAGAELAVDEINAKGGVMGRKIQNTSE